MNASPRALFGLAVTVALFTGVSHWWGQRHAGGVGAEVATRAQPGDIRMLASENCSSCVVARRWLDQHHVAYTECIIERDSACRRAYDATRSPGTPVLLVRGVPQVGFNPERLRAAL